jgi:hypothetical protein
VVRIIPGSLMSIHDEVNMKNIRIIPGSLVSIHEEVNIKKTYAYVMWYGN